MILFWNNTYYQGLSWDNNTREMFEPIPTYYYVINYLVGLVFISSLFVGLGLNPFIIMFNWSKRQSSVSLLFVITACKLLSPPVYLNSSLSHFNWIMEPFSNGDPAVITRDNHSFRVYEIYFSFMPPLKCKQHFVFIKH